MIDRNDIGAIEAGLASADPADPYARAIAVEMEAFGERLRQQVEFKGGWPDRIVMPQLRDALDRVAFQIWHDLIEGELRRKVRVIFK